MAKKRKYSKKKFRYSSAERKAYWMGVGAGEMVRENSGYVLHLPTWKVKDLGTKALESYYKGCKKKYSGFD